MLKNIVDIVRDEEEEKRDAEKRRREAEARLQPPVPLTTLQRRAYEKEPRPAPKAQRQLAGVTRLLTRGQEALGKGVTVGQQVQRERLPVHPHPAIRVPTRPGAKGPLGVVERAGEAAVAGVMKGLEFAEEEAFAPLAGRGVKIGTALGFVPGEYRFEKPSAEKFAEAFTMSTEEARDFLREQPMATQILAEMAIPLFPAEYRNIGRALKMATRGERLTAEETGRLVTEAVPRLRKALVEGELGAAGKGKPPPIEPGDVPRFPTLRETEARSARVPPEVRAEMSGVMDVERELESFATVTTRWGERFQQNWWTHFEDVLGGLIGPLRRTPEARAVRRAAVLGDIYRITQGARVRGRILEWWGRNRKILGLEADGIARRVRPVPGANIPKGMAQRLDHIVENPTKYIISEEKATALREADDLMERILRLEQSEGVDVAEVMGPYWHRIVTKTPAGDPLRGAYAGPRLPRVRPAHARTRIFGPIEEGWRLGYRYGNPLESLFIRGEESVAAVANRNVTRVVKSLGFKPSEKVSEVIAGELRSARDAFKEARRLATRKRATNADKVKFWEAETRLNDAKRAMRIEAAQVAERQPQVLGRIVTPEVAEEFNRYITRLPDGVVEQAFQLMRANMIHGDMSAAGIQLWYLFWRDNPSWWETVGYGIYSLAREPLGFVARNADVIARGSSVGAIMPPSEFLLRTSGGIARSFGRLPTVKQTQRMFEWMVFIGQTLRWKSMERLAKNADDLLELAAVARKQSGVVMLPGLTNAQAKAVSRVAFAGKFQAAMHGALLDIAKGGPAGWEARKTVAMAFSGAVATAIGINLKLNGELPNFDPGKRGFLGIRVGPGFVYPLGPYQPLVVALARTATAVNDIRQGKTPDRWDVQAWPRYVESKVSIPLRVLIQVGEALGLPFSEIRGEPWEDLRLKTKEDWLKQIAHYQPIGPMQALSGIQQGFPAAALEVAGIRTAPLSPYARMEEYARSVAEGAPEGSELANMAGRPLIEFSDAALSELERDPEFEKLKEKATARQGEVSKEFAKIDRQEASQLEMTGIWLRESRNPAAYANDVAQVRLTSRIGRQTLVEEHGIEFRDPPEGAEEKRLVADWAQFALEPSINEIGDLDGDKFGTMDAKFRDIIGPDQEVALDRQLNTKSDKILTQVLRWGTELRGFGYDDIPNEDQKARIRKREANPVLDALLFLTRPTPYGEKRTVRTKKAQHEVLDRVYEAFGWEWTEADVPIAQR